MTTPRTHHGYYVTAIIDGGANRRVCYLLGPFKGRRAPGAALRMVEATRVAALATDDPRFAFAAFGTTKLTLPIDKPLPAGRLDLRAAAQLEIYRNLVLTTGATTTS